MVYLTFGKPGEGDVQLLPFSNSNARAREGTGGVTQAQAVCTGEATGGVDVRRSEWVKTKEAQNGLKRSQGRGGRKNTLRAKTVQSAGHEAKVMTRGNATWTEKDGEAKGRYSSDTSGDSLQGD